MQDADKRRDARWKVPVLDDEESLLLNRLLTNQISVQELASADKMTLPE